MQWSILRVKFATHFYLITLWVNPVIPYPRFQLLLTKLETKLCPWTRAQKMKKQLQYVDAVFWILD
jgi:hypothetical protein